MQIYKANYCYVKADATHIVGSSKRKSTKLLINENACKLLDILNE